jgi:ribonuclease PH
MKEARMISEMPIRAHIAAVSCGIVEGEARVDLDYTEDFLADTDLNCVMFEDGRLVELQATAEGVAFDRAELDSMLNLAQGGIRELVIAQKRALAALA